MCVCVCASVCLSVSALMAESFVVWSRNLVERLTLMISWTSLMVKVKGQRSRSPGQKTLFPGFSYLSQDTKSWTMWWHHDVMWRRGMTSWHDVTSWNDGRTTASWPLEVQQHFYSVFFLMCIDNFQNPIHGQATIDTDQSLSYSVQSPWVTPFLLIKCLQAVWTLINLDIFLVLLTMSKVLPNYCKMSFDDINIWISQKGNIGVCCYLPRYEAEVYLSSSCTTRQPLTIWRWYVMIRSPETTIYHEKSPNMFKYHVKSPC